jgi:hypothetical protein
VAGAGGAAAGGAGGGGFTGPSLAVCNAYCAAIMASCTGTNQQYSDMAGCMKACSFMSAGAPTDTTGNTVGCRLNAAHTAATDTSAIKTSCWQAGPLGYGRCGDDCDAFCFVALNYCSQAAGYGGLPPYTSMDQCETECGLYGRFVAFGAPGSYAVNYAAGGTTATSDTLECRAYHLFIGALTGPGEQQLHCAAIGAQSGVCGNGPSLSASDAGTSTGAAPPYDGGLVSAINSTNWDETKYPPNKRKMLLRDQGDPHLAMIDLSRVPILQWRTVTGGPGARAVQLIGNNQVLGGREDGYEVFDETTGALLKSVTSFPQTQSAYRMVTGETMLTRTGTILTFLDKSDIPSHQIAYPGFANVRLARPTRNGTYLVPSDTKLFEGDSSGNVLWTASGAQWREVWEPVLTKTGDTLLCTGFGASCDVVDRMTHLVTKRIGTNQLPMAATIRPNFFSEVEILPSGNLVMANWQGQGQGNGTSGIQLLEFDPNGNLVWYWKQDPTIFSSLQGVLVLDGKDPTYLHVQETSPDGTWQPVMPTP